MAAPLLALGRLATYVSGKKKPLGWGHKFVKSLYSGGSKIKKSTSSYASGLTTPKYLPKVTPGGNYQKGLYGAGKKLTTAGQHLKKHRRAYGWGATGAAVWDILPGKDNE